MQSSDINLETRLLQNGCVVLYHNPFLFEHDSNQLAISGWKYIQIYAGTEGTQAEFFEHIAIALDFPQYFGRNLNALNDCLRDLDFPDSGRLALGMDCFEVLVKHDPQFAHAVLDIIAGHERGLLLSGKRLLVLVQSNDPDIHLPSVGSFPVPWNPEEWLDSKRQKK